MEMNCGKEVKLYSIFSPFPNRSLPVEREASTSQGLGTGCLLVLFGVDVTDQIAWKVVPGFYAVQVSKLRLFNEVWFSSPYDLLFQASDFTYGIYPTKTELENKLKKGLEFSVQIYQPALDQVKVMVIFHEAEE